MLEKIVVGLHDDDSDEDAVALAGRLAGVLHAELVVGYPRQPERSPLTPEQHERAVRERVTAALRAAGWSHLADAAHFRVVHPGSAVGELHELAALEGADLLVAGAGARALRHAPCAVASAPSGRRGASPTPLRRIGVGLVDTAESRGGLVLAADIAAATSGELEVIGVVNAAAAIAPGAALGFAMHSAFLAELPHDAERRMRATVGELCPGAAASYVVVSGDPSMELVARSKQLDLLVLGSRARGAVGRALLGSVAAGVMERAACPVLVVPHGSASAADARPDAGTDETAGSASPH
jgi:nucleotide-binding universal stress UspA family protein